MKASSHDTTAIRRLIRRIDEFLVLTRPAAKIDPVEAGNVYEDIFQSAIALNDSGLLTPSIFEDVRRILTLPAGHTFTTYWRELKSQEQIHAPKADLEYVFVSKKAMLPSKRSTRTKVEPYERGVQSVFFPRLSTVKNLLTQSMKGAQTSAAIVDVSHPAAWKDITISINTDNTVTVYQNDTLCGTYSFTVLGFPDKGKRNLSSLFVKIVIQQSANFSAGELIPKPTIAEKPALEKAVSDIRTILKNAFGIRSNPIKNWNPVLAGYTPAFKCKVHSQLNNQIRLRQHSAENNIADFYGEVE